VKRESINVQLTLKANDKVLKMVLDVKGDKVSFNRIYYNPMKHLTVDIKVFKQAHDIRIAISSQECVDSKIEEKAKLFVEQCSLSKDTILEFPKQDETLSVSTIRKKDTTTCEMEDYRIKISKVSYITPSIGKIIVACEVVVAVKKWQLMLQQLRTRTTPITWKSSDISSGLAGLLNILQDLDLPVK